MDIIASRQEARARRISQIVDTLKKAFSANLHVDKEKLICECCINWGMARRSVLEYINISLVSLDCEEVSVEGRKVLVGKKQEQ